MAEDTHHRADAVTAFLYKILSSGLSNGKKKSQSTVLGVGGTCDGRVIQCAGYSGEMAKPLT